MTSSPYYPPRATWTRVFRRIPGALRRTLYFLHVDEVQLPLVLTERRHLWCFLVPGLSFREAGFKRISAAMMAAWLAAACVFLLWLGYGPATMALGLMLSLHVSSIIHLLNRTSPGAGVLRRLVFSLAVLIIVGSVYRFGVELVIMPLESHGKVYVVHRIPAAVGIQRGELVACRTGGTWGTVRIHSGLVLDRVLGVPGDKVEFGNAEYRVNGVAAPRRQWMPGGGDLVVPQNTWLVWPSLDTLRQVGVSEEMISRSVLQVALVPRSGIIGKPFHRWFWRDQSK